MTQEKLKLHFQQGSAKIIADIDELVDDMNDEQKVHKYPNANDVPIPINTERVNWVERVDR